MANSLYFLSLLFISSYFLYIFIIILTPKYEVKAVGKGNAKQEDFHFFFLIPCLNEEKVIAETLKRLLDLPCSNMTIIPIDDHSEDKTIKEIEQIQNERIYLLKRTRPNAQKGKGHALNQAYKRVLQQTKEANLDEKKVIIGIIDGDGHLSENAISEICRVFSIPEISAVQCRVRIKNTRKIITLLQDIEFFSIVSAIQNTRGYTQSVGLGGNGQFMRLSEMKKLGDEIWGDCLLEDYDMTLRIFLSNGKICYLPQVVIFQQGVSSIRKLIIQRSRWVQGNLQCLKYIQQLSKSTYLSKKQKADIYYFLAQPIINLLGSIVLIISWFSTYQIILNDKQVQFFLKMQREPEGSFLFSLLFFCVLSIGPGTFFSAKYFIQLKKVNSEESVSLRKILFSGFAMSIYSFLTIPSVWIAFYRFVNNKNSWLKTERE